MRYAAKIDDNQTAIVDAFRKLGASVAIIGRPLDLLVCHRGRTMLVEVKDGKKKPSDRKLTPFQSEFTSTWPGEWHIVECLEDVAELLGVSP